MSGARINLRIDRVVVDQPGMSRAALDRALRAAVEAHLAEHGVAGFAGGARAVAAAPLSRGAKPLPARVASAAVKAVTS